jgi:hypothetical protein
LTHLKPLTILAAMSLVWTWPLALRFRDHIPGLPGDNYSFVWSLWWMRKALSAPDLDFFRSNYLLSPFGFDLINHPHAALYGFISATAFGWLPVVDAGNVLIIVSTFLNGACAYFLAYEIARERRAAMLAGFAFGGSPYIAAQLLGRVDLVTAWVIPLFALFLRRALHSGRIMPAAGCGISLAMAAYTAYDHLVFLVVFAVVYTIAASHAIRVHRQSSRPSADEFWRSLQALAITAAVFAVICLPLVVQAFRLAVAGRFVSQAYLWSTPRGVDALAPFLGSPFHPVYGDMVTRWYQNFGLDRIDGVGWIGVVPPIILLMGRGKWADSEEARRWKIVLIVFAIWALGPFLTVAGRNIGVPLPQAVARFIPLVADATVPGRAIVCVYLALGVLMALRLVGQRFSPAIVWGCIGFLALDYLYSPIPLTALDRPAVYEHLASIADSGPVIEVPFDIGDRRLPYYATIHGHPVVGGDVGRVSLVVARAYDALPVVGNLLRLSNGEEPIEDGAPAALPFRYLVVDTTKASPELIEYVQSALDLDLISSGDGKQLFAVQGAKPADLRAEFHLRH